MHIDVLLKYSEHLIWSKALYRKLVETFHVVSECNTAIYFSWCLVQVFAQSVQLFWPLVTFGVAPSNSLTDFDLQRLTETEQDQTRHSFIQYLGSVN